MDTHPNQYPIFDLDKSIMSQYIGMTYKDYYMHYFTKMNEKLYIFMNENIDSLYKIINTFDSIHYTGTFVIKEGNYYNENTVLFSQIVNSIPNTLFNMNIGEENGKVIAYINVIDSFRNPISKENDNSVKNV